MTILPLCLGGSRCWRQASAWWPSPFLERRSPHKRRLRQVPARQRVLRLALPPDQLHPGGHRRPPVPEDHGHARRPIDAVRHPAAAAVVVRATPATSRRPTTCTATRRSTTTRSPTPTSRARTGRSRRQEQARFDPMITGFNPADMYARRSHPPRAARPFPACSPASASSRIHKEFVSAKIAGETASLTNPALDRILDFAAEVGLVVILHNDIDMPFAKPDAEPVYLTQMKALLKRHPKTSIIWAHIGLGRIVHPVQVVGGSGGTQSHAGRDRRGDARRSGVQPRELRHLVGRSRQVRRRHRRSRSRASPTMLNRYPDRFLFGTDTVAPAGPAPYLRGVRHVGAGLATADAGGESESPQRQLRADLRRGPRVACARGKKTNVKQ